MSGKIFQDGGNFHAPVRSVWFQSEYIYNYKIREINFSRSMKYIFSHKKRYINIFHPDKISSY